jgi:hypothetical protein
VIQVRFLYKDNLIGEWADAEADTYLYPNPEFRADVIGVQVRDSSFCEVPKRGGATRSKPKNRDARKIRQIVPNGV